MKRLLAGFCGVTSNTVGEWLNESSVPDGSQLIRLMCYLDLIGYRVIELENLSPVRRGFVELVGFGVLSPSQAAEMLGYTSVSTLYQILQGHQNPGDDKADKMWEAVKAHREELERKKAGVPRLWSDDASTKVQPKRERRATVRKPSASPATGIMEGLLALLEEGEFDALSESELKDLRQSDGETILRLSARLNMLSLKLIASGGE